PIATPELKENDAHEAGEKQQPVSYIERFSHMVKEDEAANQASPPEHPARPANSDGARKSQYMPPDRREDSSPLASSAEDEESIEAYMAKLMQRVRGDRPSVAASQAPLSARVPQPSESVKAPQSTFSVPTSEADPIAAQPPNAAANEPRRSLDQQVPDLSELVRKAPVIGQPTNMVALRALANETARRAIGVHATKKHRRDAVTRFIVASLAGMTSLWLMLLAPDWRDLQFISACLSLLIAAYWAGQTYSTLVELSRANDYDGQDANDDIVDLNPPLPIDV
ncbi:MAG: hypothetical protein WD468_03460, partial [Pirellulales bacterium]